MQDGEYTIYVVQCRRTHESAWLKPDGPLKPVKKDEWSFASFDHFGWAWEPNISSKSHDELHKVRYLTGDHGYFTMAYAMRALKRLHKASEAGKFNDTDTYANRCQALRYEFRLVKMELSQETTMVELSDVVEAL